MCNLCWKSIITIENYKKIHLKNVLRAFKGGFVSAGYGHNQRTQNHPWMHVSRSSSEFSLLFWLLTLNDFKPFLWRRHWWQPMESLCDTFDLKVLPTSQRAKKALKFHLHWLTFNKPSHYIFQNSYVFETGLLEFHKIIVIIIKQLLKKTPRQES